MKILMISYTIPIKYKQIKTIMICLIITCFFNAKNINAQKVYKVDYESQADLKIYVVNYESQCDLKVYYVDYESLADEPGLWYPVKYESQADKTIYFVDYESQADLKIYYVDYESQAGWRNKKKQHLLIF